MAKDDDHMTWAKFKAAVEAFGVKDSDYMGEIVWDCLGDSTKVDFKMLTHDQMPALLFEGERYIYITQEGYDPP